MRHIVVTLLLVACSAFGQRAAGPGRGSAPGPAMHSGGQSRGPSSRPYGRGSVIVPYPVYLNGYNSGGFYSGYYPGYGAGGYGYDSSYYGDSGAGYGTSYGGPGYADPSQQQSPIVIVNPGYRPDPVNPVVRDYSNTLLPAPGMTRYDNSSQPYANTQSFINAPPYSTQPPADAPPTIYLIAMKDHTIFPTVAYWVDGDTLNYITSEGVRNRASLALVDRDFSKQLNDERHVEFKLPAAR
jgi:hypothetical protein